MIEIVGVDHVGVGTDMDGISPPAFVAYDDYAEWPSIGAALLARGRSPAGRRQGPRRQFPPRLRGRGGDVARGDGAHVPPRALATLPRVHIL